METADFLIAGGGVVGLALSLALRSRHPGARVVVLEKEARCGDHASGRNSGVLHAGFYYPVDSVKAQLCREGNARMRAFCGRHGVPVAETGKLVVARDESDWAGLDTLLQRGRDNGVRLHRVDAQEAQQIEPRVRTCGRALFSPDTAAVDPARVMQALVSEARQSRVEVRCGEAVTGRQGAAVTTRAGRWSAGFFFNTAGLYADRIARRFGLAKRYRILPFKGLYLHAPAGQRLRCQVYPVPDLRNPFLGVHFSVTAAGGVTIGPTAIPALWREQYRQLQRFNAREMGEILTTCLGLWWRNDFGFRALAAAEVPRYRKARLLQEAEWMLAAVPPAAGWRWGRSGIRAQLYDAEARRLEMDFVWEAGPDSLHILNAVSPAFTCALALADHLLDVAEKTAAGAG